MIEFRYRVSFYVYKDLNEEGDPIPVTFDVSKVNESLQQSLQFIDDLQDFAEGLPTIAILPMFAQEDKRGSYIEIQVYSNHPIVSNDELEKITDYVEGQISDGWGECDFMLYDHLHMGLIWQEVTYEGCTFPSDDDAFETITRYRTQKRILVEKTLSKPNSDKVFDTEPLEEAIRLIKEYIASKEEEESKDDSRH